MDYDVLILGGGIIGCAVAYELSKYSLNIALIEKDYDIADDVALINTALVYDGVECEDPFMSKLEMLGNSMFDEITSRFNIPFRRCDSLMIAEGDISVMDLERSYTRAKSNGIVDIELLDNNSVYELEPNLNTRVKKALFSKNTGIVSPYDLAIAYGEVAFDNGVNFRLEEEVIDIQRLSRGVKVVTNKNRFTCKMVVNTTPGENYSFDVEKRSGAVENSCLSYLLLEKNFEGNFFNPVISLKENGDKIYSFQTLQGNTIVSVNSSKYLDAEETIKNASNLIAGITSENIDGFYQSPYNKDNIIVDDSYISKGYISIKGNHYGQVTMTPAIAKMVCETIISNFNCKLKKDFIDKRREMFRFKDLSREEQNNLIAVDKRYAKVVCLCQQVTEGEIVDCIRRPLGARTVEGVKRRTGVALGSCQGSHCLSRIVSILARETNKQPTEIVMDSKNSNMLACRIKEFDGI